MRTNSYQTIVTVACIALLQACNPFQQAKEAIETKKTSDSIMAEFKRVNESIDKANQAIIVNKDSITKMVINMDSLKNNLPDNDTTTGVGAFRRG